MTPQRTHFRIEYPVDVRPVFQIKSLKFPVINISESGVLFSIKNTKGRVTIGRTMKGVITFQDSAQVPIEGEIIRHANEAVAIKFTQGISLQRIMTEQRWLLTKFGTLKQPDQSGN